MPQFDPTYFAPQIVWLAIVFVVLYLLMSRVALPRIAEVLEARSTQISHDLERARALKAETDQMVAAYEAELAKARSDAAGIIAETNQEIAKKAADRQSAFGQDLAKKVEAAESRIGKARDEAKAHVREIAVDVAREVAQKLLGKAPDAQAATRAVDDVLKDAG
ncbi:MAG: F0F1 ATP synthase subunit B' [Rhodospirillaceae bacterium]|nr:F0F1 ATP synthase subunit B' [Rhodospirillaceae bacterium]